VKANLAARAAELMAGRVPFAHATVVRAQVPTSARPGDAAIVHPDGTFEGFVGGHCATGSVRTAALEALETGESVLLRILPDESSDFPESAGATVVVNPCLSGGALEIFVEPVLPSPLLCVMGDTPIADALETLGEPLGFLVERSSDVPDGALAVLIASHGGEESAAIRAALDAGVDFVGLVASPTRGKAVLAELDLTDAELGRVHTPVGLDIGSRTAAEIALSILAQIVQAVRRHGLRAADGGARTPPPRQAVDPICGMTVTIGPDTPHVEVDGIDYWFCNPGCRDRFLEAR
jgi:xanthine dehydrogenase accessory factor